MDINGIDNNGQSLTNTVNGFSEMSSEDFLKIMFTELTNQDPLDPQDSNAILEQINSIRSIESDMTMMDQLGALVEQNQFASAGNLVGKSIEGLDESFTFVEGLVEAVGIENGEIILTLDDGSRVPFANVERIILTEDSE